VSERRPPVFEVSGAPRRFCCEGCAAVCRAIVESGNEDYYRYRDAPARVVDASELDALDERFGLYDHPGIQKDFVRGGGDWKEASLILEQIECAACLWLNERHLRKLDGVLDVEMDYTSQQARIRWDPRRLQLSDILRAIAAIGYVAHPYDPARREQLAREQKQRSIQRLIFAGVLGMVVMNFSLSSYLFGAPDARGDYPMWIDIGRWTSLFVTALLLAYPGQVFFRDAWRELRSRQLGMDIPVALGLTLAWLASLHATLTQRGEVYFESIAMFVLFLLAARYAELRARLRAAALLDRVATIVPREVVRVDADGEEERVPLFEIAPGDELLLSPGEVVPVDGILVEGEGGIDESLLNGEATPRHKMPGDRLAGGAVNIDQRIRMRATADAGDSTLERIQRLTEVGLHSQPPMVRLADRVAAWFVPGVLLVALLTGLYWWWAEPARVLPSVIAVLIVTCPCALALAAPVATTLGAAGLSRLGVVALRMAAIERVHHLDTLVFDKTGTLTRGEPEVVAIEAVEGIDVSRCIAFAAALEEGSEHPFARAIRRRAEGLPKVTMTRHANHPGEGIEAERDGEIWRIGSAGFAGGAAAPAECARAGDSFLFLSRNGEWVARFRLRDPLRDGIDEALAGWRKLGIGRFVVLSGDAAGAVEALAARLGMDLALGEMSPEDKLRWLESEQRGGSRLAMFGDGINDAPTLAMADVSFAFSNATDLARASSDFLLLNPGYAGLPEAFALMRSTRRVILGNLSWALAYNLAAIPLAAVGLVPPWAAAIGMSLSSTLVVANAMRLRGWVAAGARGRTGPAEEKPMRKMRPAVR